MLAVPIGPQAASIHVGAFGARGLRDEGSLTAADCGQSIRAEIRTARRARFKARPFPPSRVALSNRFHRYHRPTMTHALIVEDDADSAETMAALIAAQGFTVAVA